MAAAPVGSYAPRVNQAPPGSGAIPIPMDIDFNHQFPVQSPRIPIPVPTVQRERKDWIAGSDGHPRAHYALPMLQNANQQTMVYQFKSDVDKRMQESSYAMLSSDFRLHGGSITFVRSMQQDQKLANSIYDGCSLSALNYWLSTDAGANMYDPEDPLSMFQFDRDIKMYGVLVSESTAAQNNMVVAKAFTISHFTNAIPNIWLGRNYDPDERTRQIHERLYPQQPRRPAHIGDAFKKQSHLWLGLFRYVRKMPGNSQDRIHYRLIPYCTDFRDGSSSNKSQPKPLFRLYVGRALTGNGDGKLAKQFNDPTQANAVAQLSQALYPEQPSTDYQKILNALPRVEIMYGEHLVDLD